ncbi:hypothetical protein N7535_003046 [Penicillium sp. DV-2018c]|nr:hypothetical protein N7461_001263 [Penicillium sp. DV-2018c]KAJ5576120.1 hypothetical protein N7535_003046 [Penicillium sp. DV-2018c]
MVEVVDPRAIAPDVLLASWPLVAICQNIKSSAKEAAMSPFDTNYHKPFADMLDAEAILATGSDASDTPAAFALVHDVNHGE